MTSLMEFGTVFSCGKSTFAKDCKMYLDRAERDGDIPAPVMQQMRLDCQEIEQLLARESQLDKEIEQMNKESEKAQMLQKISGIGPINASILSIKPMESYASARDFSASLGLVPKQSSTGGEVQLGRITKQGDRYARTMLIQGGRALVMRSYKPNPPEDLIYQMIERMKRAGKPFNVICVAVANRLARTAYICVTRNVAYCSEPPKRRSLTKCEAPCAALHKAA